MKVGSERLITSIQQGANALLQKKGTVTLKNRHQYLLFLLCLTVLCIFTVMSTIIAQENQDANIGTHRDLFRLVPSRNVLRSVHLCGCFLMHRQVYSSCLALGSQFLRESHAQVVRERHNGFIVATVLGHATRP